MRRIACLLLAVMAIAPRAASARNQSQTPAQAPRPALMQRTAFPIKFVAQDTVYLSAGRNANLSPHMKLTVKRMGDVASASTTGEGTGGEIIAELEVLSVADTSAVCTIEKATADLHAGDIAYLDAQIAEGLAQAQSLGDHRKYPQVVSFSEGDPLEEEVRDAVPRPPLPEVNRLRGRVGLDYSSLTSGTTSVSQSSQLGFVFRADMTRIAGTHWSLSGYWRGRLNSTSSDGQQSLQDLLNRTYHLSLTFDSPDSRWVAGFGRLYLPWASSLDTLDGGYVGRRLGHHSTVGMFAGSTPDPTSWSYNPDQRVAGTFVNFEGGSYDALHFTSTTGAAINSIQWRIDRPFIFFENSVSYKRLISVYHSLRADNPRDSTGTTRVGAGVNQSFLSVRIQPTQRVSFDINHNYLRDVPTFDPRLVGTGLLDKYLFQGLSGGVRVETWKHVTVYSTIGRSRRNSDAKTSWNQMYGITAARLWKTGLRADAHYSTFDSSFGKGHYESFSLSRNLSEALRLEAQIGRQFLVSPISTQTGSRFVNILGDANLGTRFFLQGGFSAESGSTVDYHQWTTTLGYRFDNHMRRPD